MIAPVGAPAPRGCSGVGVYDANRVHPRRVVRIQLVNRLCAHPSTQAVGRRHQGRDLGNSIAGEHHRKCARVGCKQPATHPLSFRARDTEILVSKREYVFPLFFVRVSACGGL